MRAQQLSVNMLTGRLQLHKTHLQARPLALLAARQGWHDLICGRTSDKRRGCPNRHSYSITAARSTTMAGSAALFSKAAPSSLRKTGPCHGSNALVYTGYSDFPARAHVQREPLDSYVFDAHTVQLRGMQSSSRLPKYLPASMPVNWDVIMLSIHAHRRMRHAQAMQQDGQGASGTHKQRNASAISPGKRNRHAHGGLSHRSMHCASPSSVLKLPLAKSWSQSMRTRRAC